jgi:hypothetical protein
MLGAFLTKAIAACADGLSACRACGVLINCCCSCLDVGSVAILLCAVLLRQPYTTFKSYWDRCLAMPYAPPMPLPEPSGPLPAVPANVSSMSVQEVRVLLGPAKRTENTVSVAGLQLLLSASSLQHMDCQQVGVPHAHVAIMCIMA